MHAWHAGRSVMSPPDQVESALSGALPAASREHLARLAQLLIQVANGSLPLGDARSRIAAEPAVASLLGKLAGEAPGPGTAAISLGTGNSIGSITIGDVAGRDL